MRIISKHKDYYDSASGLGVDMKQVFNRKTDEFKKFEDHGLDLKTLRLRSCNNLSNDKVRYYNDVTLRSSLLFFCGSVYPFVKLIYHTKFTSIKKDDYIFFDVGTLSSHMEEHHNKYFHEVFNTNKKQGLFSKNITEKSMKEHFSDENKALNVSALIALSHVLNSPYFTASSNDKSRLYDYDIKNNKDISIVVNPILKELGFQKIKDPYTCFQEINQYCFGVLSNIENGHDDIEDKYKITGKGFDPKYGFRTRPKVKK